MLARCHALGEAPQTSLISSSLGSFLPVSGASPFTFPSKRLHLCPPPLHSHASKRRHRQASDLTQALSLTNLGSFCHCTCCDATPAVLAHPSRTPLAHLLQALARLLCSPRRDPGSPAKHPIHTAQPIIPGLAAAGRLRPAVRFLFNVLVRPKPSRPLPSPSSPPSKFKSLVDR